MWHGGRWLTSSRHHTSQHASVVDSSWRPDLPEVSTTTAAREELRAADGDEHVMHKDAVQICPMKKNAPSVQC